LPLIAGIEGRTNDMLITRDGRRVYWLNPVFYGLPVSEAQIVQKSLDLIHVCYVPAEGFDQTSARTIADRMRDRMGEVEVRLEQAREIPRNRNGKFQAVICEIRWFGHQTEK
jgi:phenylacetate-coenzyme A ligase PaaK-like adenylate-forming protein